MKPDLSIIIPCYNCSKTLKEAVDSCFKQGLAEAGFNYEIVMVDDGSVDSTRHVMDKLVKESGAVKNCKIYSYSHKKNKGGGATRNTAIKYTKADIIFCLDSDDMLGKDTLLKMFTFFIDKIKEGKKCDGVGINRSIKFKGENINDIDIIHTFGYVDQEIPFEALLQKDEVYCSLYSTFMISKKALNLIDGYPENHGFDTQGIAWRFLASGLIAYTCPDAEYLHRTHFTKSYYLREANSGKVNYNWRDLLNEHMYLFTNETKKFITEFNCKDFTKNLFDEFKNRENIFKINYIDLLGTVRYENKLYPIDSNRIYISRNSFYGILLRVKERIKKISLLYSILFHLLVIKNNLIKLSSEKKSKIAYYEQIEEIIKSKKIVLDIPFGGIGDSLAFSTLPRLLKESYEIDFYISKESILKFRNPDIYKIIFETNPYLKGIADDKVVFRPMSFVSEESIWTILTDWNCKNVIERIEQQFKLKITGLPEIYYKPNILDEYERTILIDKNTITGKKLGWKFKKNIFENKANKYLNSDDKIEYIDTKKQDLFKYVDMIYSCKRFVGTFSGGSALSACFKKSFTVIWPTNGRNGSNYQFRFKKSSGIYTK